jgi:hypothetical protein
MRGCPVLFALSTMVYSVGFGIVVGAIVALFRHRAAGQSFRSGMPTALPSEPALPTVPTPEIDVTAPRSPRSPAPRAKNLLRLRLIDLLGIIILIAFAGGSLFS